MLKMRTLCTTSISAMMSLRFDFDICSESRCEGEKYWLDVFLNGSLGGSKRQGFI